MVAILMFQTISLNTREWMAAMPERLQDLTRPVAKVCVAVAIVSVLIALGAAAIL